MPEEINRLITDQLSELLFTPSSDAVENLQREGIEARKIHFVGNVMIDTLVRLLPSCAAHKPPGLPERYILVTLHRPSNVDDVSWLGEFVTALSELSEECAVVFPVHPRTRQRLAGLSLGALSKGLHLLAPQPYLSFLAMQQGAAGVDMGRNIFQSEAPQAMIAAVNAVVHKNAKPKEALEIYSALKAKG
jgi:UDP-N-acetylglucosamine 2-epimerase (non-hydrolysing)